MEKFLDIIAKAANKISSMLTEEGTWHLSYVIIEVVILEEDGGLDFYVHPIMMDRWFRA